MALAEKRAAIVRQIQADAVRRRRECKAPAAPGQ
jgi:hypothetical protein